MSNITVSEALFDAFDSINPAAVSVFSLNASLIGISVKLSASSTAKFMVSGSFTGVAGTSLAGLSGDVTGISLSINGVSQFNASGLKFDVREFTQDVFEEVKVLLELAEEHSDDIHGSEDDDEIEGSSDDDNISGDLGDDDLFGDIGDDDISGGEGADHLDGGEGSDHLDGGEGDDDLVGGDGDDNLTGGHGNDHLTGGTGVNILDGGAGDDSYTVDSASDVIIEAAGSGTDTEYASFSDTLDDNLENLVLTGTAASGTGNAANNAITGNAVGNALAGGLGDDKLDGAGGNDKLSGGDGNDHLIGGSGNDSLTGGGGNDSLTAGAGTDSLAGGAGNDAYTVDSASDLIIEAAGSGTDTEYASFSDTLDDNLENLVLTGSAVSGTGNAANNAITGNTVGNALAGGMGDDKLDGAGGNDKLSGGDGNDHLIGGSGNDSLTGGSGNDSLTAGAGTDSLAGGAGNDAYTVDSASDLIIEAAGSGTDTEYASFSDTLDDNLENLVLTGTAASGTGNAANNAITGNAVGNALAGGLGNDKLDGAGGNDKLSGGDGNDVLTGGAGHDILSGGMGNDLFDFNALSEMVSLSGSCDKITDFKIGDKIDFSTLDANVSTLVTNEGFAFIGGNAFSSTNATGQLSYAYDSFSKSGWLYGSTDADNQAEFTLQLTGVSALAASDLIL